MIFYIVEKLSCKCWMLFWKQSTSVLEAEICSVINVEGFEGFV